MGNRFLRLIVEKVFKVSARGPLPGWAGYTFRGWWKKQTRRFPRPEPESDANRVVYFHGCSTNTYEPHIGKLAVAVLEHIGLYVEIPPQTCCGLPAQSNGDFKAARRYARTNIDSLVEYARRGIPIVGTSASCMTAIKGDYQHVLAAMTMPGWSEHTYDFMSIWPSCTEGGCRRLSRSSASCPITRRASSRRTAWAARRSTCST